MRVDHAGDRDPAARELLDDHRVGRQVEPHPAVLLGDGGPEQAELLHLLDDRLRELVLVVVVLGLGKDLLVDELADHLEDRLLLVGLLVERGGYGHARRGYFRAARRGFGLASAPVNFTRDVVEAAPARNRALVELRRDGSRREWTLRRDRGRGGQGRRPPAQPGPAPRRRRDDAGRQPLRVGARPWSPASGSASSCCPAPSSCAPRTSSCACGSPRPRLVVCDQRNADVLTAAGWDGPTLWAPWGELGDAAGAAARGARGRATRA